jgi:hypothetical protein
VTNKYVRAELETCLDPKPVFDFARNERRCTVSKIEVTEDAPAKNQNILNRVLEYASRLVA